MELPRGQRYCRLLRTFVGYHVEATDGSIGKVDEVSSALDGSCLVVDTGPWIFGRRLMLPAGVVNHVDHVDRKVYVDRTKDEVKDSPEVEPDRYEDPTYREKVAGYYAGTYGFCPLVTSLLGSPGADRHRYRCRSACVCAHGPVSLG